MKIKLTGAMIEKLDMKMTVYRYKVFDHQHDDLAHIPPHYATREYIEQLERTTIIEYDHLEVDVFHFVFLHIANLQK